LVWYLSQHLSRELDGVAAKLLEGNKLQQQRQNMHVAACSLAFSLAVHGPTWTISRTAYGRSSPSRVAMFEKSSRPTPTMMMLHMGVTLMILMLLLRMDDALTMTMLQLRGMHAAMRRRCGQTKRHNHQHALQPQPATRCRHASPERQLRSARNCGHCVAHVCDLTIGENEEHAVALQARSVSLHGKDQGILNTHAFNLQFLRKNK